MTGYLFRCSSIGKLMTEPRTKSEGPLSIGAKTYIRSLAAQEIFGVEFEVTSKEMEKGLEVEPESIALLNRVRGLSLVKNTERKSNDWITGEADLFHVPRRRGHDLKSSWSLATFPITVADCEDRLYEWQMRGYMALWDADEWEVNYAMVDTPERLMRFEPFQLHSVSHIPEHMRLTTWLVKRDAEKESAMWEKVRHAREYFAEVVAEFDRSHPATVAEVAAMVLPEREAEGVLAGDGSGEALPPIPESAYPPGAQALPVAEFVHVSASGERTPIQMGEAATVILGDSKPLEFGTVVNLPTRTPGAAPTLRLGQINERLHPLSIDAAGLAGLGFPHSATDKAAKLYHEHQFPAICDALIRHLSAVRDGRKAA